MPKNTKTETEVYPETGTNKGQQEFLYQYRKDYEEDWELHRNYISDFDAYEAMLIGQVYDSVSKSIDGSKITDSYATTLAKERADRVVAKLPDGETEAVGRVDVGKAAFMDILRQKWIYPNANAQHKFLEKVNMWQLYSSVYGYMPMFYDWNVSPSGYVGPDCWLWNPRNLIPQQGRVSINDMEYITALTWVSKKYLQDIISKETENETLEDGWNRDAVQQLLEKVDNETTDKDGERDTYVERLRVPQATKKGICLATRYEAGLDGNWCTFAPDHGFVEVRKIANPHKNGRIPFVVKYSQPLFDSFYGLGDFQRAKPLQFARDALTNFYFKGIKMNLIPPIVANANGVLKHTLDYREGAVMFETLPNSIRRLETSPAGLSTYQGAMTNLTGSLLSLYGTQNASIPGAEALNPSQGKTPAAIEMFTDKEATRDGAERRHLEAALEDLTDGFFSLVVNIGTEDIPINLFSEDIKAIVEAGMPDVLGMFQGNGASFRADATGTAAELRINPETLKGVEYRFNITPNSTAKVNKEKQLAGLERLMAAIGKFQNIFKDDQRIEVNWSAMMNAYKELSDVKGADQFIKINDAPSPQEQALMEENQQLQEEVANMQTQMENNELQAKSKELQTMLQPNSATAPLEPDTTINKGGAFQDPDLAAVADELNKM